MVQNLTDAMEARRSSADDGDGLYRPLVGRPSTTDSLTPAEEAAWDVSPPPPLTLWDAVKYMGPGWLVSIAYVDPGNYQADISSGKATGYSQNWVVLWTSLLSMYVQVLCVRLATRTRQTLSQAMADEYPDAIRYLLYFIAEFTVIITDLPEVIGFGFAINLFSGIPTWIGVVLSLITTMLFLSSQHFGFRALELIVASFVGVMSVAIFVEWGLSDTDADAFLRGAFIPGISGVKPDALTCLGIIGCVVMPHNLYLHSAAALTRAPPKEKAASKAHQDRAILLGTLDLIVPVLVTVGINWGIVCLATIYVYDRDIDADLGIASFPKYLDIRGGTVMWGFALIAAAQSSCITTTYTGQYIMDGFLKINLPMWQRAILTRLVAIIPCVLVAACYEGRALEKIIDWVNQALAILLPVALVPLVKLTDEGRPQWETAVQWALALGVTGSVITTLCIQGGIALLLLIPYMVLLMYLTWKPRRKK